MNATFPTFRRAFLTGLVVLVPVVVTGWVFVSIFRAIDDWIRPWLLKIPMVQDHFPQVGFTGIGFITAVLVVMLVGLFASNLLGRAVFGNFDRLIARIPWIKGIYSASKELSSVIFSERSEAFRKVIVFEYPRRGLYSLGFVTREMTDARGNLVYNVFLPTTPNPTSGFFLMVPESDAVQLPVSIEEGIKLVVSGGSVISGGNQEFLNDTLKQLQERSSPPEDFPSGSSESR